MWDTAGQERFNSLSSNYVRTADIALLFRDARDVGRDNSSVGYDYDEKFPDLPLNCNVVVVYMKSDLADVEMGIRNASNFFSISDPLKIQKFVQELVDILWFGVSVPDSDINRFSPPTVPATLP